MKFRMFFGWVKTVILAVIMLGALAIIGLDIAMLAGAKGVLSSPAIAAVSLVAAVIILVAAVLVLANSYYAFKEDKLVVVLGFFADKVAYENILSLKQNGETKELYLIAKGIKETDGDISIRVNIPAQKTDDFIKQIHEKAGGVIVEVFTPEKKDKNKK